jgi:hypothetical protein
MKSNVRILGLLTAIGMISTGGCSSSSTKKDAAAPAPDTSVAGTGGGGSGGGGTGGAAGRDGAVADSAIADAAAPDAAAVVNCGPYADGGMPPAVTDGGPAPAATTSFFVSSQTNMTGNLGGLAGADMRCQTLAAAVGLGAKTWHAYLSVEHDPANANMPRNARDRIGVGPWFNAKGVMVAADLTTLHARRGDPTIFIDEHSNMINGNWTGSPSMTMPSATVFVEHDILTGSNPDGTVMVGSTCLDWTSAAGVPDGGVPDGSADGGNTFTARVGHSDGFGPNCAIAPDNFTSWNSSHNNAGCNDNKPRGGNGRIYCFAVTP